MGNSQSLGHRVTSGILSSADPSLQEGRTEVVGGWIYGFPSVGQGVPGNYLEQVAGVVSGEGSSTLAVAETHLVPTALLLPW